MAPIESTQSRDSRWLRITRDPFWQFGGCATGLLIGILAIAFSAYIFYVDRPVKQVDVIILSDASLLDVRPEVASDIEVLYQGTLVQDIRFMDVRILNSGNQPITRDDYNEPITFSFDPSYQVVEPRVTASTPDNIGLSFNTREQHVVEAESVLLNPGDFVESRFILINAERDVPLKFDVEGRIAGVRDIRLLTAAETPGASSSVETVSALLAILGLIIVFTLANWLSQFLGEAIKQAYSGLKAQLLPRDTQDNGHQDVSIQNQDPLIDENFDLADTLPNEHRQLAQKHEDMQHQQIHHSLEWWQSEWGKFAEWAKEAKPEAWRRMALRLKFAEPTSLLGNQLTVSFLYSIHRDKLLHTEEYNALLDAIKIYSGDELSVEIALAPKGKAPE